MGSQCTHGGSQDCEPRCDTVALLVTGRRGPFPSYRLNGIYGSVESSARLFQRLDRPEVSVQLQGRDWRCEVQGKAIARRWSTLAAGKSEFRDSGFAGDASDKACAYVLEEGDCFLPDPFVFMLAFPLPATERKFIACKRSTGCCYFGSVSGAETWEVRQLDELRPPIPCPNCEIDQAVDFSFFADSEVPTHYQLWGEPGTADNLTDLVQGNLPNCGVLAAVDAFGHADPFAAFSSVFRSDSASGQGSITVQLYNPIHRRAVEWPMGILWNSKRISSSNSERLGVPKIEVAKGTCVPRYARSMSCRCWGILLEAAMAELAGGYDRLGRCEPGVAWLALAGPTVSIERYKRSPRCSKWECFTPAIPASKQGPPKVFAAVSERRKAWRQADTWRLKSDGCLEDFAVEVLLETSVTQGLPVCLCPQGFKQPHPEQGEPAVSLPECLTEHPDGEVSKQRFLVGHAYSVRKVRRVQCQSQGADETPESQLWLRLRDPRTVRLFWVPWQAVLHDAAECNCSVHICRRNA